MKKAVLLLAGALWAHCAVAADAMLPVLQDARQAALPAVKAGQPLLILFSMPGCIYCPEVRNNYLAPMVREGAARPGSVPVVREVDITSSSPLKDFEGKTVQASEFSRRYKVRATPTVVMLDERGQPLTQALVGSGMAGFYGGYLEGALESARASLNARKP